MTNARPSREGTGSARRHQAGFTLVELLVALIAGLLVAVAAFAFSKSATRIFSQEARIASAQLSVSSGFQRLQNDLARAGFLGTPNMPRDHAFHRVCAPDFTSWPTLLKEAAGLKITAGTALSGTVKLPDSNYPDSLRIVGSFAAADMFPIANVAWDSDVSPTYSIVTLGVNNGPMARAGLQPNDTTAMKAVFKPGRILRVLDMDGNMEFSIIADAGYDTTAWIKTTWPIPVKGKNGSTCGVGGYGTQSQASVLSIIDYGIVKVAGMTGGNAAAYQKTLFDDAGSAYGDDSRTELVRREVLIGANDPPDLKNDNTVEIVAEYAVDLRFGLWVANSDANVLSYVAPSTSGIYTRTTVASTYVEGTPATGPESVRAVEARLAIRSREVDRATMIDPALAGGTLDGGFMYRFPLPNDAGAARVRTLVATISLSNQRGDTWQ